MHAENIHTYILHQARDQHQKGATTHPLGNFSHCVGWFLEPPPRHLIVNTGFNAKIVTNSKFQRG